MLTALTRRKKIRFPSLSRLSFLFFFAKENNDKQKGVFYYAF